MYLRSQKIKPGQLWEEAHNLRPCEMLSFKETRAIDICRDNPGGGWVGPSVTCGLSVSLPAPSRSAAAELALSPPRLPQGL